MANRLNGNVLIVDSAMGNANVILGAKNVDEFKIQAISFFSISTLGSIILTQANTSLDVIFNSNVVLAGLLLGTGGGTVVMQTNPVWATFPLGLRTSDLKVPTLTAGTAYIYLA